MSKSTIGPHAPSKARSQYSIEPSSGGIFFEKKGVIASLVLSLTACGGGDGSTPGSTPPVAPPVTPAVAPPVTIPVTIPGTLPIESIPVSSSSYIELGPIAGGTVSFQTLSGKVLSTGGTKDDGSLDYNPRDIVSKMGSDQWLLVNVSGGRDTDVDDDGIIDAVHTPILGSFRMLVPRSTLELGGKIVVNPRSGMISELLLAKKTAITLESLDIGAKQSGAEDQNNDGVVNYKDTYSVRMRDVKGVSKIVPATSGYITSIHSGNAANKTAALSKVAKTENHIMTHIIPANDTNDHAPSLELTTSTPGATILYTLDSSNPVPGGATTRSALSRVVVPFQNAKIYYREYTTINGQEVLGKVAGFDLLSDWTELTQSNVPYNSSGKMNTSTESSTYKNIPYYITTTTNSASSGYTYPKTITCKVGVQRDAGCHYGPYMIWSPEHEATVRSMIDRAIKVYIDTPTIPIAPVPIFPLNYPVPSSFVSYRGGYGYQLLTTMNISGTSDYPASVRVSYTTPLSNNNTTETTNVSSAAKLATIQAERINEAKASIDLIMNADQFEPNYIEFLTNTTNYGGGSYYTTFTYSGNAGQDYPGSLEVHVTYRNGSKEKLTKQVDNASQKILSANSLENQAKIKIDNYNPTFPVDLIGSNGPFQYGNKGSEYTFKVKYNSNGTSMNYPALVWIEYRSRSTGQLMNTLNTYGRTIANSSVEKDQYYSQLEQWVMGQMVALGDNTSEKTRFATNWKLHNILPLSSAHAATTPTNIIVQKNDIQLPNFSPYNSNTTYGKFFAGGNVWDHFVRNEVGKGGVAGKSMDELAINIATSQLKNSASIIEQYAGTCVFDGEIGNPYCALTPAQQAVMTREEIEIFIRVMVCKQSIRRTLCPVDEDLNSAILKTMELYLQTNIFYYTGTNPVVETILSNIMKAQSKGESVDYYIEQLKVQGISQENLDILRYTATYLGQRGYGGLSEVYPENFFYAVKALFGGGKIGISMLVERATGKILSQAIIGEGGLELIKYEARILAGKVVFSDATGNVIRLEQGLVGKWGFNYIFKTVKDSNFMRVEDMMRALANTSGVSKVLGKTTIDSFADFEKIVAYTIRNGTYKITENSKAEYILDFGGKLLKVIVDRTDGRLLNISF